MEKFSPDQGTFSDYHYDRFSSSGGDSGSIIVGVATYRSSDDHYYYATHAGIMNNTLWNFINDHADPYNRISSRY